MLKVGVQESEFQHRAAVLDGLAGATYDEIVADYMMSFCNYYGIEVGSEDTTPSRR